VKRTAPDRGVATAALAELIDGPTTEERAAGYYSELGRALSGPSSCDGRDFQLAIRDGVATVRFCRSMTSAGIGQDARVRAQIEATLTQFSTIRSVRLLGVDGHCLFDESGQDRCLATATAAAQPARTTASR
jgi:spore germination protein GerM